MPLRLTWQPPGPIGKPDRQPCLEFGGTVAVEHLAVGHIALQERRFATVHVFDRIEARGGGSSTEKPAAGTPGARHNQRGMEERREGGRNGNAKRRSLGRSGLSGSVGVVRTGRPCTSALFFWFLLQLLRARPEGGMTQSARTGRVRWFSRFTIGFRDTADDGVNRDTRRPIRERNWRQNT